MPNSQTTPSHAKENEISIIRFYDAPLAAVWKAWTDPAEAAHWWGPRGFTITTSGKDLRPGGYWDYMMHGPDGQNYPNRTTYLEVEDQAKLVYDHGASEDKPPLFRVKVLFSVVDGKTKMDMTMTVASKEAVLELQNIIKAANGHSTWDRLGEYLELQTKGKEAFIINRRFDAPLETVFAAWSDPKQLAQWLPPTGTSMKFIDVDIRSGGSSFYWMGNDNFSMYGRAYYQIIEKPHRLVYTQEFCDKDGNPARHPFAPTWPATMLTTITLSALNHDQTLVNVKWEVCDPVTAEEMQTFIEGRESMNGGWGGSFDKLDGFLAKL